MSAFSLGVFCSIKVIVNVALDVADSKFKNIGQELFGPGKNRFIWSDTLQISEKTGTRKQLKTLYQVFKQTHQQLNIQDIVIIVL